MLISSDSNSTRIANCCNVTIFCSKKIAEMSLLVQLCLCIVSLMHVTSSQQLTAVNFASSQQAQQILSSLSRLETSNARLQTGMTRLETSNAWLTSTVSRLETTISQLQTSNAQLHRDLAEIKATCRLGCTGQLRN